MSEDFPRGADRDDDLRLLIPLVSRTPEIAPERARRVHDAVRAELEGTMRWRRTRRMIFAVAASLVLTVAGVVVVERGIEQEVLARVELVRGASRDGHGREVRPGDDVRRDGTIETSPSTMVALRFPGGASIRIAPETRVTFASAEELLLHRGTVYVDSQTPGASLVVRAGDVRVKELGTQFETSRSEALVRVRVREGRVALSHRGTVEELGAGVEGAIDGEGRFATRSLPASAPEWGWVIDSAPPVPIEGRSLAEFLAWVSRETGRRVDTSSIPTPATKVELHGSIEGLNPEEALASVLPTVGLRAEATADEIRLVEDRQ